MTLLHTQVCGNGPDLVLLHGWGMNAQVWQTLAAELARNFCVHALDLPGVGANATMNAAGTDAMVNMLAAAMPAPATVCGWSLGGQLALAWAHRFPAQVARLVLLATTPRFVCNDEWPYGMTSAEFEDFAADVAGDLPRARMRFLALQANGDHAARGVLRELREAIGRGGEADANALAAGLGLLRETDLRAILSGIDQPALVMHGVNDAVIPLAAGEYLATALPRAEFMTVPGAGHAVFVTREVATTKRIREFHGGY